MHDLGFFGGQGLVDLFDHLVGQLLNLGGEVMMIVFADLMILLHLLQVLHAVTPNVTYGDPRLLGIFVCDFGDLLTTLLIVAARTRGRASSLEVSSYGTDVNLATPVVLVDPRNPWRRLLGWLYE